MPRSLLILNRLDVVQATVRALQFQDQLRDASFALRTPAWTVRLQRYWPHRPALRWPADWLTHWACRRQERQIVRQASHARVVYNVGVPSWRLHQRLVEARRRHGFRLVTDMVDAQWLPWFAQFGWDRLDEMLTQSDAVFVTNRYLAEYAQRFCERVLIVPDAPQLEVFDRRRDQVQRLDPEQELRVGWIGGRDTVFSLHRIHEALEALAAARPKLHLRILGAPVDRLPRFEKVRWSTVEHYDQETMVREALQMHIGVFPQFHVEESVCRGALKSKIYMAAGAAVVAERLGENEELIEEGRNGLLAESNDQWRAQLLRLADDHALRQRLAAAGLATIREQFSGPHVGGQLQAALEQAASPSALGGHAAKGTPP